MLISSSHVYVALFWLVILLLTAVHSLAYSMYINNSHINDRYFLPFTLCNMVSDETNFRKFSL
jgi:hypothetical protein